MRKLGKKQVELATKTIAWLRNPASTSANVSRMVRDTSLGQHPGIGVSNLPGYSDWKYGTLSSEDWATQLQTLVDFSIRGMEK